MLRKLFRILFILLILNVVDSIVCILVPFIIGTLHYYPTFVDTLRTLLLAPEYFRTNIMINLSFIRIIVLILAASIIIAYLAHSKIESVVYYLGLIFLIGLSILVNDSILPAISISSVGFNVSSIINRLSRSTPGIIILMLYHIPLSVIPLLITAITQRYRTVTSELRLLESLPGG